MAYRLNPGEQLTIGQQLEAPTQPFNALLQGDGNFVVYRSDVWRPLWSNQMNGQPVVRIIMQADGNLVAYTAAGQALWASNTAGQPGNQLTLQDDGNLVIAGETGTVKWESGGIWVDTLPSSPTIVSWGPNRFDMFLQGPDAALWHNWFDGVWHGWESLGGALSSPPSAASLQVGRLDIVARGTDGTLQHIWFDGQWHPWESLGGTLWSAPTLVATQPGVLWVTAKGPNDQLSVLCYDNGWGPWISLPGTVTSPPSAIKGPGPGTFEIYARSDNLTLHRWFYENSKFWGPQDMGGLLRGWPMAIATPQFGMTYVAGLGENATVYGASISHGTASAWQALYTLPAAGLHGMLPPPPGATTSEPTGVASRPQIMGSVYCDAKYRDCCNAADKIEDDFERFLAFTECKVDQIICYLDAYASVVVDWVTRAMENVTNWITLHPQVVEGAFATIAVLGTIALCIWVPPVGAVVAGVEILAVVGTAAAGP